jgi:FHS family L-fucose permease-like MFS transporter
VVRPYVVVGLVVLLLGLLIENLEFPKVASEPTHKTASIREELHELLSRQEFRFGLLAMAVFMTGLVFLWSSNAPYGRHAVAGITRPELVQFSLYAWSACALGRVCGTALMYRIDPARLLFAFAVAACGCTLATIFWHGYAGVVFLMATSFFTGIMFPTIFGLSVAGAGNLTKMASGLMVTAAGVGMCVGMLANQLFFVLGAVHTEISAAGLFFAVVVTYARHSVRLKAGQTTDAVPDSQQSLSTR